MIPFSDRAAAGHALARHLTPYKHTHTVVLGLARGGVEVARAISIDLSVPFDVLVVKKIPSPRNTEMAIGAVAPEHIAVTEDEIIRTLRVDRAYIDGKIRELDALIEEKTALYRKNGQFSIFSGAVIILVDDGAATGATFTAAALWCRHQHARKIVGAIPVAPPDVAAKLAGITDDFIVLEKPTDFRAVGQFYIQFPQLTDRDVIHLLREGKQEAKM